MVGQRNQRCQGDLFFDLVPFRFEGQLGDQRRRPVSPNPVNRDVRSAALAFQRPAEKRSLLSKLQNEAEAFLGVIRVTVQGDSRSVLSANVWFVPKTGNPVLGQSRLSSLEMCEQLLQTLPKPSSQKKP